MIPINILSDENFRQRERDRIAAGNSMLSTYPAGTGWYCPWYIKRHGQTREELWEKGLLGGTFLSVFYFRDWFDKRAPIMLVCPGGSHWCIDQKSTNGQGWTITEENGLLSAQPSIVVPGYHGYLSAGAFTPDLEGRTYT